MATWKKVIVSGSKADLNEVTASTANITTATIGTATISAGTVTGITDIVVADGGTGASTFTDGGVLLGSATDPITAMAVLGDSEMIVGDGSGDPVAESGATLRTSIGVGTGDSPTFTGLTLSGDLTVQGADIDLTNAATDIDLVDNNASALSFDASGKTGILEIVSTDNAEQVKMSGALEVIGNVSGSASSTGSFGNLYIDDDALIKDRIYFNDFGGEYISGDGTDLNLTSGADINIPADIGLTFGNDGEIIEGNGTDLTIKGGDINITAESDVNIPSGIGLTFGNDGEKIEGNGTKLDIAASEIDFSIEATGDINIGSSIGLTFGDDGEKIEGNGTRLSIASGDGLVLDSEGDIEINADGGDVVVKDNTAILLNVSATDISGSSTSTGSFGKLEGDGASITNLTSAAITNVANDAADRVLTMDGDGTGTAEANLSFDGSTLSITGAVTATGNVSSSVSSTGSFGKVVAAGVLNATTLQHGGVIVPTGTAISSSFVEKGAVSASFAQKTGVSGSFAQKSAVSSSFAQKSGVSGSFILQSALSGSSTVISGSAASTGSFGQLEVAGDVAIEGATANTLLDIDSDSVSHIVHVAGNGATQLSGSLKVTGSIGTSGNITPSADNSIDLGAASYRWANVYTADLHLNNEGNPNTVDGTTGNWTVQEGEDYIYIVNNKSNKKFKLMLEEIE